MRGGTAEGALWVCPICARQFAKRNQAHSCQATTVDSHFHGKPAAVKALFQELRGALDVFGPVRVDAVKSSINLVAKHHFGGIRVLRDGLQVGFVLSRPLAHPRILRTEKITPTIYAHRVKLTRVEDLDGEILAWLREAYDRASQI